MKPARFDYFAPGTVDEALALLAEHGDQAKPLAGGQSLIPAMNFRLARPQVLVDLNLVAALSYIRANGSGLAIGAMTRQRAVERSDLVARAAPLLAEAMPSIAHPQIRNRGTGGGSLAHAAPSAELARAAGERAASRDVDPPSDIHASAAYRRRLVAVLTRRALERAFERAEKGSGEQGAVPSG